MILRFFFRTDSLLRLGYLLFLILIFPTGCKKESKPTVETIEPGNITTSSVISGGLINDDGGSIINSRGIYCDINNPPNENDFTIISDGGSKNYYSKVSGLSPGTTYYLQAFAINSAGKGLGKVLSFNTLGTLPSAITQAATDITVSSVKFNGQVNPSFLPTRVCFEYGLTTNYGKIISATQDYFEGNVNCIVTACITKLDPSKTYHYRLKAENSLGISYGNDRTFMTSGGIPIVSNLLSSTVSTDGAHVSGFINPNFLTTGVCFDYGTTTSYGSSVSLTDSLAADNLEKVVVNDLSGLIPGTEYHYRIRAGNNIGTTFSPDATFRTNGAKPLISSVAVSEVTKASALVSFTLNPGFLNTTITVEYGLDSDFGNTVSPEHNSCSGSSNVNISVPINGLTELSNYKLRIKGENQLGSSYSKVVQINTYGSLTDYDGNIYKTIRLGTQIWMGENLRSTHFSNGEEMSNGNIAENISDLKKYYFAYNGVADLVPTYGLLYNYFATSNNSSYTLPGSDLIPSGIQGVCPSGWHVPSKPEWAQLVNYLGGPDLAGGKMKALQLWKSPNNDASDLSGFHALPSGGYDKLNYGFGFMTESTFFWGTSGDWYYGGFFLSYSTGVGTLNVVDGPFNAHPVRCLKD